VCKREFIIPPLSLQTAAALHNQLHEEDGLSLYWDGVGMPGEDEDADGIPDVFDRIEAEETAAVDYNEVDQTQTSRSRVPHVSAKESHTHAGLKNILVSHFDELWIQKKVKWPKRVLPAEHP
jgi:hypothetical protein